MDKLDYNGWKLLKTISVFSARANRVLRRRFSCPSSESTSSYSETPAAYTVARRAAPIVPGGELKPRSCMKSFESYSDLVRFETGRKITRRRHSDSFSDSMEPIYDEVPLAPVPTVHITHAEVHAQNESPVATSPAPSLGTEQDDFECLKIPAQRKGTESIASSFDDFGSVSYLDDSSKYDSDSSFQPTYASQTKSLLNLSEDTRKDQVYMARPESCNCFSTTFDEIKPKKQTEIPKIRPPPQSPRRSRPSSTHSTLSLNPDIDFITFDNPPQEQMLIRRSSQSLRVNSRAAAATRRQKQQPRLPGSASLVLPVQNKPFDPLEWKAYVAAAFPSMEDKDFEIKIQPPEKKTEKILKTLPQAAKIKQYTKLKQQSSVEERDDEIRVKHEEIKIKHEEAKIETSLSLAEKRRRFLLRKQTHSAPDTAETVDDEIASTSTDYRSRRTNLCMGGRCRARGSDSSIQPPPSIKLDPDVGIEHLDDLKYPDGDALCHFCEKECSQSIHDEARLKIVSGGLIQTRDGSSIESPSQYMNLPSPMFQCEEDSHVSFQQQLEQMDYNNTAKPIQTPNDEEDDVLPEGQFPPASALTRRKALVSTTLRTDAQRQQLSLDEFARRSSTVVYPEMQICPGDLMVYSKALINAQLVKEKGKKSKCKTDCDVRRGTWSILRIFDRHRKAGSITGLEVFLEEYKRNYFEDPCLARYRRMTWTEFYSTIGEEREKRGHKSKLDSISCSPYDSNDEGSSSSLSDLSECGKNVDTNVDDPEDDEDDDDNDDVGEAAALICKEPEFPIVSLCNENYDYGHGEDQPDDDVMSIEEGDKFAMSRGSLKINPPSTLRSKCKSTEFNVPLVEDKPKKTRALFRAQSSQQFSAAALSKGVAKLSLEEGDGPKSVPKFLNRPETPSKPTPKLSRQLSDLFKKKDALEKIWVDKGKAEKQETAMTRFQKRLTRTQSERVMGICRLASWRQKEKPLIEPKSRTVSLVSTVSHGEYKRREAVWDLFQTECVFLFDHLTVLKNVFMEPLKGAQVEGFLMFAEPQLLFGNLDDLFRVTRNFCRSFIRLLTKQVGPNGELPTIQLLEALFKKNEDGDIMTQAYHCYALNYINALTYLETLRSYEAFNVFEKWCGADKRCRKLQLTDLLVAPVQHIMKIPLLLKEILTRTENPDEAIIIRNILEVEEKSLRQLDDKMKWLKNYEHLLELQKSITWASALEMDSKLFVPEFIKPALKKQVCDRVILSPRRKIINEGQLSCWDTGKPQEMILLLFDDMLLITRKKKRPKKARPGLADSLTTPCHCGCVYKQPLSLDRVHLYEPSMMEMVGARMEHSFLLIVVNRFQQVVTIHTFQASSRAEKENWITLLREAQDNFKKNLETTIFRTGSPTPEIHANIGKELKLDETSASSNSAIMPLFMGDFQPDSRRTSAARPDALALAGPSRLQFLELPIVDKKGKRKISI